MGTSAGYSAPTTPQWSAHKRRVSQAVSAAPASTDTAAAVVSGFIRANGGAGNVATGRGHVGGQTPHRAAQRIGGFLADVAARGAAEALRAIGLGELAGRSVAEIIGSLEEHFCDGSNTLDDVDVRNAVSRLCRERWADQTLEEFIRDLEAAARDDAFSGLLEGFFSYVIYEQLLRVHHERLLARAGDDNTATFEAELLRYIQACVRDVERTTSLASIQWDGNEGAEVVSRICQETLDVFGED